MFITYYYIQYNNCLLVHEMNVLPTLKAQRSSFLQNVSVCFCRCCCRHFHRKLFQFSSLLEPMAQSYHVGCCNIRSFPFVLYKFLYVFHNFHLNSILFYLDCMVFTCILYLPFVFFNFHLYYTNSICIV